jgi:dATP pyrophosphohydrolase
MTEVRTMIVDVYVLRMGAGPELPAPDVLVLHRSAGERCAGTWETVHGHIDEGEAPAAAALRELREETGLVPDRLYNVSRVETFYLHARDVLALIPVFCALVPPGAQVTLSGEHDRGEWVGAEEAARRFAWPRERRALADALQLFGTGTAGGVEDVLRVV